MNLDQLDQAIEQGIVMELVFGQTASKKLSDFAGSEAILSRIKQN